ncbi:glutaredoxin family protein [Fervidibacillus halotolerans]|uniref:Glutaredoxin family protein n=1 Tax=Fervidibacillus halotolerans TaxID=2980027 RepID=A0A9E8M0Z5_9BACI|nr:glutaredoxin family protein [Fervidibacillus halotolerans]WAA13513.1 glutaredoxin family protein [Fervidibacillus halotolerans]
MNDIKVYTTSTCPYCVMVKNFLEAQGLPYTEINVQQDPIAAQRLIQATGQLGVPQINVNGHWVLGFDPEGIMTHVNS